MHLFIWQYLWDISSVSEKNIRALFLTHFGALDGRKNEIHGTNQELEDEEGSSGLLA